jgi:hypothetical protein
LLFAEGEPFFRTLQDRVVFSRGSTVSAPVNVVVRFSDVAPDSISGEILGTNATYTTLEPVFHDRSDAFCKMESVLSGGRARLASSRVWLRSISRRSQQEGQPADEPLSVAGQFECLELVVDERHADRNLDLTTRDIKFYLPEDVVMWGPSSRRLGCDAFTLSPSEGEDIAPGLESRFTMKGQPCLVYDDPGRSSSRRTLSCILPTVLCSTTQQVTEYSDDAFHAEAKAVVDDVLLLASLVCRRVIRWHRYTAFGHHGLQTLVRSTRHWSRSSDRMDVAELPIQLHQFHDFVPLAIPRLRDFRKQDLDLELPILYIVASHETTTLDQRFSYAVLCLERLVDLHARSQGLDQIMPTKAFDPIRHRLSLEIENALASRETKTLCRPPTDTLTLMKEKLAELNRPPFWTLLCALLDTYGVLWTDLYPPGLRRPTLISTRNKFIHSSEKPSYRSLMREAARVQALCERVLLRMLGWKDPYAPPEATRQWLVRPEEEQGETH